MASLDTFNDNVPPFAEQLVLHIHLLIVISD